MKREIKFRFWQPAENYMLNWSEINISSLYDLLTAIDSIPMQYTGLTNKKGKEIYEGDIITINLKNNPFKIKCTVIYKQSQCQFMAMEVSKKKHVYQLHHNRNIEVIGNIYENPELL